MINQETYDKDFNFDNYNSFINGTVQQHQLTSTDNIKFVYNTKI